MRVIPDTNVIVSGLLWRGNPRHILDAARDGIISLYTSPVLLAELEIVLRRPKLAKRLEAANVTVQELVDGFSALATVIDAEPIAPVIIRDPDDDAVLACALAAEGEAIVSGDDDLLSLKYHQAIRILTATELLAELSL